METDCLSLPSHHWNIVWRDGQWIVLTSCPECRSGWAMLRADVRPDGTLDYEAECPNCNFVGWIRFQRWEVRNGYDPVEAGTLEWEAFKKQLEQDSATI